MGRNQTDTGSERTDVVPHKARHGKTIAIMSSSPFVGCKTAGVNIAVSLAQRNFKVLFGLSPNASLPLKHSVSEKKVKAEDKVFRTYNTQVQGLWVMKFLDETAGMSVGRMEEMAVSLPEKIRGKYDYFIYHVGDPYGFPDRYMLLNTDVFIMVVRSDATAFSNIFLQLEKLSFIPKPPKEICLVFNKTKDMDLAFEAYQNILIEAKKMNVRVPFTFMGSIPFDGYRQAIADQGRNPLSFYFPDSPFGTSVSLIANKIINY